MTTGKTDDTPTGTMSGGATSARGRAPLQRSVADRKLAGVAGGFARWAGLDPLLVRVLLVVLALFGGTGFVLYGVGWLLLPEDGAPESEGQKLVNGRGGARVVLPLLVTVVGLTSLGVLFGAGPDPDSLVILGVVALVAWLFVRNNSGRFGATWPPAAPPAAPAPPAPPTSAVPDAPVGPPPVGPRPPPLVAPPPPPPAPPAPPRVRSRLGLLTVSAALLAVGTLLAVGVARDDLPSPVVVLGTALAVVGAGLVVGAFWGRARWLFVLAIPLAIATLGAQAADTGFGGSVGEREWRPETVAAVASPYRLAVGSGRLDLSGLDGLAGQRVAVDARVGVGELVVYVPEDARVELDGRIRAGNAQLPDAQTRDGSDIRIDEVLEPDVAAGATIVLTVRVGLGSLEVRRG